jgi:hypothetical protein
MSDVLIPCKLCGASLPEAEAVACGLCAAPHHRDCWEYAGLCSTYGCGGLRAVAYSRDLVPREVQLDESLQTVDPEISPWSLEALRRPWIVGPVAKVLPATLKAGLQGGLAASLTMIAAMGLWLGPLALLNPGMVGLMIGYGSGLIGIGLFYGWLSAFLSTYQHRYPLRTTLVSGVISLSCFLLGAYTEPLLFLPTVILGILSASTAAEWLFGPYRRWGRRLGKASVAARYFSTATIFMVCSLIAAQLAGIPLGTGEWIEALVWSIVAAVAAGHSLEVGKEEYRKHLIALVDGREDAEDVEELMSE